jgi:hypothetical protein
MNWASVFRAFFVLFWVYLPLLGIVLGILWSTRRRRMSTGKGQNEVHLRKQ